MGTYLTSDVDGEHEGYAGQILNDGTITGTYSAETRPRMVGQVVAACGCGWTGTTRYPWPEPFDEHAEALALAEWEHHARAALGTSQRAELDHLDAGLRALSAVQVVADGISPQEVADRLATVLRTLDGLSGLAQRLYRQATERGQS